MYIRICLTLLIIYNIYVKWNPFGIKSVESSASETYTERLHSLRSSSLLECHPTHFEHFTMEFHLLNSSNKYESIKSR